MTKNEILKLLEDLQTNIYYSTNVRLDKYIVKTRNCTEQEITDLEIAQIENEQATTDLEIAVLELQQTS